MDQVKYKPPVAPKNGIHKILLTYEGGKIKRIAMKGLQIFINQYCRKLNLLVGIDTDYINTLITMDKMFMETVAANSNDVKDLSPYASFSKRHTDLKIYNIC